MLAQELQYPHVPSCAGHRAGDFYSKARKSVKHAGGAQSRNTGHGQGARLAALVAR